MLAGLAAFAAMSGRSRSRFEKLPTVITVTTLAVLVAQPLGNLIQSKITTTPDVAQLRIEGISRQERGGVLTHHVKIAGD